MQFFWVPRDWEMVRLIMLCQAVSAGCVCLCVGVRRLCREIGGGGACTLPGHYIKLPLSARGLCTECQLPPDPPPLSVLPSPHLLAFQLLWLRLNSPPVVFSHCCLCGIKLTVHVVDQTKDGVWDGSGNSFPKQDQFMQPSWTEFRMISLLIITMLNAVPPHLRLQRSSPSLPRADSKSQSWTAQSCDDNGVCNVVPKQCRYMLVVATKQHSFAAMYVDKDGCQEKLGQRRVMSKWH